MKVEFENTEVGTIINDTNYGHLVTVVLSDGNKVVMSQFDLDTIINGQPSELKTEEFDGDIYLPLTLVLSMDKAKAVLQRDPSSKLKISGLREYHVWSANKDNLHAAACALSLIGVKVDVQGHCRRLSSYVDGVEVESRKSLQDFYYEVTQEQLEETTW